MSAAKVDLTQGSIRNHVLRMLGPFSLAVIALISTGIVDTIYLGNLKDPTRPDLGVWALAAIGLAFPLTFLGNSANIGLGAGTVSAVSRALGQDDANKAKRHAASAIIFALLVMSVIITILMSSISAILTLFEAEPEVTQMAKQYLIISLPALVIVSISMICNNILRAGGEAILPSSIMILGAVINIILDPFLIFGWGPFPRMEIQGAALATLTGNVIAAMFGLYMVGIHRKAISFVGMSFGSFSRAVQIIGGVGVPAMFTNIIVPIGTAIAVYFVSTNLSTKELAAFTLSSRAELISVGLLYALSACIGAITGQNGGAGLTDRVRHTFKTCYAICFYWSTLMAGVLALFAPQIAGWFTDDAEVIAMAVPYFYIVPITVFAYGFVFVSAAGLNALGRPRYGLIFTIIRSLILYTALIYFGIEYAGLKGAFVGIAIANVISGFIAFGWTMTRVPMTAKKS